jgi:hypothetical protein
MSYRKERPRRTQVGLRPVPMTIIFPYAHTTNPTNSHITHTVYDFGSVLAFTEKVFHLPNLGRRDVSANNMMDAFDFSQVWNGKDVLNVRSCPNVKPAVVDDDDG